MPSRAAVPEVSDLLEIGAAEVSGVRRNTADARRGSGYDVKAGVGAVIFHRQALRDRDAFRAIYFDTCSGDDADQYIEGRYKIPRLQRQAGGGIAVLERPTAGAGAGTVWKGTRFALISGGATGQRLYQATANYPVAATDLAAPVPIEAVTPGSGSEIASLVNADSAMRIEDPLWDSSWAVSSITCTEGREREKDDEYKARVKEERRSKRRGYAQNITDACVAAGAGQVALFPSDWGGSDFGLNHCFVGDDSFETPEALLRDCRIAVDSARVLGADLLVFGMTKQSVTPTIVINLWVPATQREISRIQDATKAAVIEYFNRSSNAFHFTLSSLRAAILRAIRTDVQSIDITGLTEPVLSTLFDTVPLIRYTATKDLTTVSVAGPS